jgi:hypothetical protein
MKIESLNLNELFRFLITGLGFYFVLQLSGIKIEDTPNLVEKSAIIVMTGILIYYLYRTIIYPVILRIIDRFNNDNVRYYIENNFEITKWDEKNDLWLIMCHKFADLDVDTSRTWSHSIHMLFIVSILSFLGVIICLSNKDCVNTIYFFLGFAIFLFAAVISELSLEKRIYRNFILNKNDAIDEMVCTYKENKKSITDKT